MKKFMAALLVSSLFTFSAFAVTKLRIPLRNDSQKSELLSTYNKQMKKAGLELFPDYIEVSNYDEAKEAKGKIEQLVEEANKTADLGMETVKNGKKQKRTLELSFPLTPSDSGSDKMRTCYVGDPLKVGDVVGSLADVIYSDQISILGSKYKKQVVATEQNKSMLDENEQAIVWKKWVGKGEAVLVETSHGDSGDDLEENIILRCH